VAIKIYVAINLQHEKLDEWMINWEGCNVLLVCCRTHGMKSDNTTLIINTTPTFNAKGKEGGDFNFFILRGKCKNLPQFCGG